MMTKLKEIFALCLFMLVVAVNIALGWYTAVFGLASVDVIYHAPVMQPWLLALAFFTSFCAGIIVLSAVAHKMMQMVKNDPGLSLKYGLMQFTPTTAVPNTIRPAKTIAVAVDPGKLYGGKQVKDLIDKINTVSKTVDPLAQPINIPQTPAPTADVLVEKTVQITSSGPVGLPVGKADLPIVIEKPAVVEARNSTGQPMMVHDECGAATTLTQAQAEAVLNRTVNSATCTGCGKNQPLSQFRWFGTTVRLG